MTLEGYLEVNPWNIRLLSDAAEVAFAAGAVDRAGVFLQRHAALHPLPPRLVNLSGVVALAERRFEAAADTFARLRADGENDPEIAVNLAWAKTMLGAHEQALELLASGPGASSQAGAILWVQVLHQLGRAEDAKAVGAELAARFPQETRLMAALSLVAMDLGDAEEASAYASRGGDSPDALATLGLIDIDQGRLGSANDRFASALAASPNSARAHLGQAIALMIEQRIDLAALHIQRAAELFNTHIGSWTAAGWAHYLAKDLAAARAGFERALALDERFAQAQGGLAVVELTEGRIAEGKRRTQLALRLDRHCLSAIFAKMMLLTQQGRGDIADRIRDAALHRPIDASGRTLAQEVIRFTGLGPLGPSGRR